MVETSEQVRPLAPASERQASSDDEATTATKSNRKRWLKCCGCVAALLVIEAIVVVILIFTVFKVKDPIISMNKVTVDKLELINGTTTPLPGTNMSLTADVSVKNPNFASFKYKNTTTTLFYRGDTIGEARGPPGRARARRTMRMNITVDVIMDRVTAQPGLQSDMNSGLLTMSSYTQVGGRVKILMISKHVTVKMNCSVTVNITTQAIQEQKCKRKVKL